MADKKIEKALYGPSTTEVALGAILGLIAGVLAACVFLIFKPVAQVKELPKEPVRGTLYFLPGSESGAKNRGWQAKQKTFAGGGSVDLVEDELNAWAGATFAAAPAAAPAGQAPAGAAPAGAPALDGILNPGKPNFKIKDGVIQIGFPCVLNWYGLTHEVFVITTGTLERSGDSFAFSPQTLYLGSCPLHQLPSVAKPLLNHLIGKKKVPDDILSAWAKLGNASVDGSTLKLAAQ